MRRKKRKSMSYDAGHMLKQAAASQAGARALPSAFDSSLLLGLLLI